MVGLYKQKNVKLCFVALKVDLLTCIFVDGPVQPKCSILLEETGHMSNDLMVKELKFLDAAKDENLVGLKQYLGY